MSVQVPTSTRQAPNGDAKTPAHPVTITSDESLLPYHCDQLRASGLSDATIAAAGFFSVTDAAKMARLLNLTKLPKGLRPAALAIPFVDADGRNGYCRLRPDRPRVDAASDKPIKYESPRYEPNQIYLPPGVAEYLANPEQELAITEGEKKSLASHQAGLPCIGLVGVYGWKPKGKEALLPAMEHIEWQGRRIYLIWDSDAAAKNDVKQAMVRLGSLLKLRGANVRGIILPAGPAAAKVGLDDYLLAHGFGELRKLMDAAEEIDVTGEETRPNARLADPGGEAKSFLATGMQDGLPLLRFWRGSFHYWSNGRYVEIPTSETAATIVNHLNSKFIGVGTKITADLINQVKAQSLLRFGHQPPCWIGSAPPDWNAVDLLACRNGIVNLMTLELLPATPRFFTPVALDFDFCPEATRPDRWLAFLEELWPNDPGSVATLQEWMGYLLTPDTRQQKILTLIGPKRSGKGTIARITRSVVGDGNVCGPTLAGLAGHFGLQPLLGKTAAIISDAQLGTRTDQSVITERLLAISGEDALTVDRKHLESVTCKLLTRFMILGNKLPRLTDNSGALPGRMILLHLTKSFYGREDVTLTDKLLEERSGILLWSIGGWVRLRERGYFVSPKSSEDLRQQLHELSSPVDTFVRERCLVGTEYRVAVDQLYEAWRGWCHGNGWRDTPTAATFGRDLMSAFPLLTRTQPRDEDGGRYRAYEGIGLRVSE